MKRIPLILAIGAFLAGCATTPETPQPQAQQTADWARVRQSISQWECAQMADSPTGSPQYNEYLATCPHPNVTVISAPSASAVTTEGAAQVVQGGFTKVCIYHTLKGPVAVTVRATAFCPLSPP